MFSLVRYALCSIALLTVSCSSSWYTHTGETATATQQAPQECPVEGTWAGLIPDGPLAGRPLQLTFYQGGMARGTSADIQPVVQINPSEWSARNSWSMKWRRLPKCATVWTRLVHRPGWRWMAESRSRPLTGSGKPERMSS